MIPFYQPQQTAPRLGRDTIQCLRKKGSIYILYHRIHPQKKEFVLRELCIDSLNFDDKGNILKVKPGGVANFTM